VTRRRRAAATTLRQQDRRFGLALVAPTFLVVMALVVFPVLWTVLLSMRDLRLVELPRADLLLGPLSLENYQDALRSPRFWEVLRTTLLFSVLGTVTSIGAGLVAALSLHRRFRGRGIVRGLVLIPYVMPVVAAALVWRAMFSPQYGLVNEVGTRWLGWERPVAFLSQESATVLGVEIPMALTMLIAFETWKTFPFAYLFILARLQAMPAELDEAARIDGAVPTQRFWHIIAPQLRGVLVLLLFLRFIWTFQSFNEVYLLTGGAGGTEVISIQVYNTLVNRNDVGGAAALGVMMAGIMAVALYAYYRASHRRSEAAPE
jgi:multiple sugar transport system permease protein